MGIEYSSPLDVSHQYSDNFSSLGSNSPEFRQLNKRFIITPQYQDYNGQPSPILVLHEKLSNRKFLLRVIATNNEQQIKRIESQILSKLATSSHTSYLSSLTKISQYIIKANKNYCGSLYKAYIMFEIADYVNLSDYLVKRFQMQENSNNLSEILYKGLLNIIDGIRWLRYFRHAHQAISISSIFIRPVDNTFILGDPWLTANISENNINENFNTFSPEKIKSIRNELDIFDPYLSDLFSLGIVGLSVAFMFEAHSIHNHPNMNQYYNRGRKTIDLQGIHLLVNRLKDYNLRRLLTQMLGSIQQRAELLNNSSLGVENQQLNEFVPRKLGGKRGSKISEMRRSFGRKENLREMEESRNGINFTYTPKGQNTQSKQFFFPTNTSIPQNNQEFSSYSKVNPYPLYCSPNFSKKYTVSHNNGPLNASQEPNRKLIFSTNSNQMNTSMNQYKGDQIILMKNIEGIKSTQIVNLNSPIAQTQSLHVNQIGGFFPANNKEVLFEPPTINRQLSNTSLSSDILHTSKSHAIFTSLPKIAINHEEIQELIIEPKHQNNDKYHAQSIIFGSNKLDNNPQPQNQLHKNRSDHSIVSSVQSYTSSCYRSEKEFRDEHKKHLKLCEDLKQLESKVSNFLHQSQCEANNSAVSISQETNTNQNPRIILEVDHDPDMNPLTESEKKLFLRETQEKQQIEEMLVPETEIIESKIVVSSPQNQPSNSIDHESSKKKLTTHYSDLSESEVRLRVSEDQPNNNSFVNIDCPSSRENSQNSKEEEQKLPDKNQQKLPASIIYEPIVPPTASQLPVSCKPLYNMTIPEEQPSDLSESENSLSGSRRRKSQMSNLSHENQHRRQKTPLGQYVEESYENGGRYEGYKVNNKRHGQGTFYYRDGGYYKGRWRENMMHGFGSLYYDNQKLAYQGEWYQDQFHGRGKVYNDRPQQLSQNESFDYQNMNESQAYWVYYTGYLNHDMKEFMGKLMLSNGQYYEGEFSGDIVHGKGKFYRKNGEIVRGVWKEGQLERQL